MAYILKTVTVLYLKNYNVIPLTDKIDDCLSVYIYVILLDNTFVGDLNCWRTDSFYKIYLKCH